MEAALVALSLATACVHPRSAPKARPLPALAPVDAGVATDATALPPGCRRDFTGDWEHEDDPSYRYRALDDGTRVTLIPYRAEDEGNDAGGAIPGMSISLRRAPEGFKGDFRMLETVEGGRRCPASFGAQVVACEPAKLTLRIEQSYAIDKDCKRVDTGGPDIAEHVLVRRRRSDGGAGR